MKFKDISAIADQIHICSFDELCQRQRLDSEFILQCVEFGITEIEGESHKVSQPEWMFSAASVKRIEKAQRLHIDLEVNIGDLALVLDLLDEADSLRSEVKSLRRQLQHWEQVHTG